MKYIYILLLVLSSFFNYNLAYSKENIQTNAFFVPTDSIQSNTATNEISPKTTTIKKKKSPKKRLKKPSTSKTSSTPQVPSTTKHTQKRPQKPSQSPLKRELNKPTLLSSPEVEVSPTPKRKYTLDDTPTPQQTTSSPITPQKQKESTPTLTDIEKLAQTPINELLSTIPYPNNSSPSFKQLYENHVMDLRILYNNNKLLPNLELEEILEKANTIRRFDVK